MQDKHIILFSERVKDPTLPPGRHVCRVIAVDRAPGEAFLSAVMAQLSVTGHVIIEQLWQVDNLPKPLKLKPYSYLDMILPSLLESSKSQRSLRNRHHKRKPQPNCGPRGANQW